MSRPVVPIVLALVLPGLAVAFAPDVPPPECFAEVQQPGVDVLFVLDLTGSMGGVLASAKSEATAIMGDLAAAVPDIRFGAASHMDYPSFYSYPGYATTYGSPGDYPWRLDRDLTTDTAAVQAAIDGLSLGSGADGPESYVTAMYEATESVSWGSGRVRVVVFFADNVPHDLEWNGRNTGGEPGRDAIAQTADDLDWQTVVAGMAAHGIRVVGVNSGGAQEMMSYLATETGGDWTTLGSGAAFRQTIVDMVLGVVGGPTPDDEQPPTVAVTSPTGARILGDGADLGPSPFPETAVLSGDLAVTLAAADDCKLRRVDVTEGGVAVASFTDLPLAFTYPGTAAEGLHTLDVRAVDWAGNVAETELSFRILRLREGARAQGVHVGLNVPASVRVEAGVAQAEGPLSGESTSYGARSVGDVSYGTLRALAVSDLVGTASSSMAWSRVEQVSLLGGRVVADVVRASSSSAYDASTLSGSSDATGSAIAGLVIDGAPVDVASPDHEVPLPGLGFVRLFEIESSSSAAGEIQQVNMIHVFLDTPSLKGEVIVGSASSKAGFVPAGVAQHRLIEEADDAGTDADARPDAAHATPIAPGAYSGRLDAADRADAYSFTAVEGERIVLALLPAAQADVRLVSEPSAQPPAPGLVASPALAPPTWLRLFDPDGNPRDRTDLEGGDRIEFNADVDGTWTAVVEAQGLAERNYTLAFDLLPVVFLSGDDLDGDAPEACADARVVEAGLHAGVLRRGDPSDAWAFHADLGDVVTVALKPDELDDGANFDLFLYDPDCRLVSFSQLGGPGLPKGSPDAALALPAERTGLYRAVVARVDGSANYYLHLATTDPQPTVAPLQPADSEGPGDAVPMQAPAVAQGRFPDAGDDEDWYLVTGTGAPRLRIAVEGGAASYLRVEAYRAGVPAGAASTSLGFPAVLDLPDGQYHVRVVRASGGGNYLVAAASADR